jgi:hypothetical protein
MAVLTIERIRTAPTGTNSKLWVGDKMACWAIELDWMQNMKKHSCIPNGFYTATIESHAIYKNVLRIHDVPNRSGILVHPANNALKELQGCIAPVTTFGNVIGTGNDSRKAMERLISLLEGATKIEVVVKSSIFELVE